MLNGTHARLDGFGGKAMDQETTERVEREVQIPAEEATLTGNLAVPSGATGIVLFAHGSGSSRHSPRNRFVAEVLQKAGVGTLLFDLLTRAEEEVDLHTREHRFDIGLLTERLLSLRRCRPNHSADTKIAQLVNVNKKIFSL
jgi:hypothetical protein